MNSQETLTFSQHKFEIVDEIPLGYTIWNIGKNMPEGYLPLCRLARNQPFPGARNIETDTLKAIRVERAQDILAAIGYGPDTLDKMERYVKLYECSIKKTIRHKVRLYKTAIPIMKKIKGIENLSVTEKWNECEEDIER